MERLKTAVEWLPVGERQVSVDYREKHFPVIEIMPEQAESVTEALKLGCDDLLSFASYRNIKPDQIWAGFDIDYVLRNPAEELMSLRPGRIPPESIRTVKEIEDKGVHIGAFITNQPLEGHQIAEIIGEKLNRYQTARKTLSTAFKQSEIISAGKQWNFLWRRPKNSQPNVNKIAGLIRKSDFELYAFFGDRYGVDGDFWAGVQSKVKEKDNKFVFVKLPNPSYKLPGFTMYANLIP